MKAFAERSESQVAPFAAIAPRNRGSGFTLPDAGAIAALMLLVCIVLGKDITKGGFRYGDAPAHAMDGVLIHDWIASGPQSWLSPMRFAKEQYAHYPTLGIGRHYPPGFAVVEAAFFGLLGISPVSARATVVFLGVAAAIGVYVLVRGWMGRRAGFLAAAAWLSMPATVEWGRQTMLEVPTAAALVWSAVAVSAYVNRPSGRRLFVSLAAMVLCLLMKQTAVFIFPAAAAAIALAYWQSRRTDLRTIAQRRFDSTSGPASSETADRLGKKQTAVPEEMKPCVQTIRGTHVWIAAAFALAMPALAALSLGDHASLLFRGDATYASRWTRNALTGYLTIVPGQATWPIVIGAVIGWLVLWWKQRGPAVFLLAWFGCCYAMLTLADFRYDRYVYPALVAVAICSGIAVSAAFDALPSTRTGAIGKAICVGAVTWGLGYGFSLRTPTRPDYGPVVAAHREILTGRTMMFSGLRDGDFVFAARQHLPWRSCVIVRSSKLLYSCSGRPNLNLESRTHSATEVRSLIESTGLDVVIVERKDRTGIMQEAWLREVLADEPFTLLAAHNLAAGDRPSKRDVVVDVFASSTPHLLNVDTIEIPIPHEGLVIHAKLTPTGPGATTTGNP